MNHYLLWPLYHFSPPEQNALDCRGAKLDVFGLSHKYNFFMLSFLSMYFEISIDFHFLLLHSISLAGINYGCLD